MKFDSYKILKYSILALLFCVMIDPRGTLLHAKEALFALTIVVAIFYIKINNIRKFNFLPLLLIVFFLLLPIWGIVIANVLMRYTAPDFSVMQIKAYMFVLLMPVLSLVDKDFLMKSIAYVGLLICFVIFSSYIAVLIDPNSIGVVYETLTEQYDLALVSHRQFFGLEIVSIFYRTAPIIVFSLTYFLYSNFRFSKLFAAICFFSFLFTATRTPILVSFLILFLYFNDLITNRTIKKTTYLVSIIIVLSLVLFLASEKDESSNIVKYGNMYSYLYEISHGVTPLIGSGLGSEFYAAGNQEFLAYTELTYMDLLREYGIPLGIIIMIIVYFPFFKSFFSKTDNLFQKRFMLSYALYMVIAGTNPLLISSTGFYVLCMGYALILPQNINSENENQRLHSNL